MISIAMATYNGEKYLAEQIDSILAQTISDFELIICDDCSKDNTVSILKEYEQKDSRIKLYINEQNLGFRKNFEKAISLCSGEYIALCDQDDVWTKTHLEVLYKNIKNNAVICGNNELIDENGKSLIVTFFESNKFFSEQYDSDVEVLKKILLSGNCFQGASMLLNKNYIDMLLPIPEKMPYHDLWFASVACVNNLFNFTDDVVTLYRQHNFQVTRNLEKNTLSKNNFSFPVDNANLLDLLRKLNLTDDIKIIIDFIKKSNSFFYRITNKKAFFLHYEYIFPDNNKKKVLLRFVKYVFLFKKIY